MPEENNEMISMSELEASLMVMNERTATPPFSQMSFKKHVEEFLSPSIYQVNDLFDDLQLAFEKNESINNIIGELEAVGKDMFTNMSLVISSNGNYANWNSYFKEEGDFEYLKTAPRFYLTPIIELYEYATDENSSMLLPMLDRYLASFVMMWGGQIETGAINMCTITMEEIALLPLMLKKAYSKGSKTALPALSPILAVLTSTAKTYYDAVARNPAAVTYPVYRCLLFWEYSQTDTYTGLYYDDTPYTISNFKEFTAFLTNITIAITKLFIANRILILSDLRFDTKDMRYLDSNFSRICKKALIDDCFQTEFSISDVKTNNLMKFLTHSV